MNLGEWLFQILDKDWKFHLFDTIVLHNQMIHYILLMKHFYSISPLLVPLIQQKIINQEEEHLISPVINI